MGTVHPSAYIEAPELREDARGQNLEFCALEIKLEPTSAGYQIDMEHHTWDGDGNILLSHSFVDTHHCWIVAVDAFIHAVTEGSRASQFRHIDPETPVYEQLVNHITKLHRQIQESEWSILVWCGRGHSQCSAGGWHDGRREDKPRS